MLMFPRYLLGRLFFLAGILAADCILLAITPHSFSLLGPFAPLVIVWFAVFLGLGYTELGAERQELPFGCAFFLAHLTCVLTISLTDIATLHGIGFNADSIIAHLILRALLLAAIALLALACIPLADWLGMLRKTKLLWFYSAVAAALAWCLRFPMRSFWDTSSSAPGHFLQALTFQSVRTILVTFLPNIYVDPDTFVVGTQRFSIFIAEECSGLEGLGLVLAFTVIWLWYFRQESRFPQALLLIPCALACVWLLNVLRISALVLIGDAGHVEIAMVGFHSQAGWIAFTSVAFTFSMATRKLAWVRRIPNYTTVPKAVPTRDPTPVPFVSGAVPSTMGTLAINQSLTEAGIEDTGESPAIGVYVVPFLAILAASFVSKSASGHFEWLYPLRFLAAAIAIWHYRAELKQIDWRFGWLAPVTGIGVFVVWLVPSFWTHDADTSQLGQTLAALSPIARWSWITFRIAAAVITVPIAEELAFRGYLARRLVNREFDSIPFSAITVYSIAFSSAAFGLMHGKQWIVGILAGLAYAGVMKWKGRLGDAVVAHATSNLLLAVWVLSRGDWSQWGH